MFNTILMFFQKYIKKKKINAQYILIINLCELLCVILVYN
jgi:hypothetical protein